MKSVTKFLAVCTGALALALPATAGAATTIGATMSGTPTGIPSSCQVLNPGEPVSCLLMIGTFADLAEQMPAGKLVPEDGVITRWRVAIGAAPTVTVTLRARILRFTTAFVAAGTGASRDIPESGGSFTFDERLPVEKNDYFAIDANVSGPVANGPHLLANLATNASVIQKTPTIADGQSFVPSIVIGPPTKTKLMINADVEPDVDRDGYGDETQDLCVARGDVHTACPAPTFTSKLKAVKNGLLITVDRAAKASVTLDRVIKGRKVGKKCKKKARRGKRCDVFTRLAQWNEDLVAGANTLSYAYKVGGKRLKKGSYRASIMVTNAEGLAVNSQLRFKVKR